MARTNSQNNVWANRVRVMGISLLILVGSAAFSLYVIAHWVERQIFDTDNWVALVSPLPKQPVVSTALGSYISDKVFEAVPVKQKISDALPPQAVFLAGPLTDQLQNLTTTTSQKIVASDGFQTLWSGANRLAMDRLVTTARGQTPPLQAKVNERFDINISDSVAQLRTALGNAAEAIPALQPLANRDIEVSTDLHAKPRRFHDVVRAVDTLVVVLPFAAIACFLFALALSYRRRRTVITITFVLIGCMLLELILLRLGKQETLNAVHDSSNLAAVGYIYDTLVGWLRHMIFIVVVLLMVVVFVALAAGPANWAMRLREYLHLTRIRKSQAYAYWSSFRAWMWQWQYYVWLGLGFAVLAGLALALTVTPEVVMNAVLLLIGLCALAHIVATPPTLSKNRTISQKNS